jgi:hypothetical protein
MEEGHMHVNPVGVGRSYHAISPLSHNLCAPALLPLPTCSHMPCSLPLATPPHTPACRVSGHCYWLAGDGSRLPPAAQHRLGAGAALPQLFPQRGSAGALPGHTRVSSERAVYHNAGRGAVARLGQQAKRGEAKERQRRSSPHALALL